MEFVLGCRQLNWDFVTSLYRKCSFSWKTGTWDIEYLISYLTVTNPVKRHTCHYFFHHSYSFNKLTWILWRDFWCWFNTCPYFQTLFKTIVIDYKQIRVSWKCHRYQIILCEGSWLKWAIIWNCSRIAVNFELCIVFDYNDDKLLILYSLVYYNIKCF